MSGVTEALGKQVGPLPLGAWIVVVGGGLGIGYAARNMGGDDAATTAAALETDTAFGTGPTAGNLGAGIGGTQTPNTGIGSVKIETNEQWRYNAMVQLLARGYNAGLIDQAISKYFSGEALSANEQAVIDSAMQYVGPTPQLVPPTNTAPIIPPPLPNPPTTDNNPTPVVTPPVLDVPPAQTPRTPAPSVSPTLADALVPGSAVQVTNPVPNDGSTVVVGKTPDGYSYVYGGSQQQAQTLVQTPIVPTVSSPAVAAPTVNEWWKAQPWYGKKVAASDPNVPNWYKMGFMAPRFPGDN